MNNTLINQLKDIVVDVATLEISSDELEKLNNIQDVLDSLNIINFVGAVEEKYNFTFDDDSFDIELISDFHRLSEYILQLNTKAEN